MSRTYDNDTTIDDKCPSDQLEVVCACGHHSSVTWGLWSRQMQLTPLRQIARRMMCKRCGKRSPTIMINGYGSSGGQLRELWRWPKA